MSSKVFTTTIKNPTAIIDNEFFTIIQAWIQTLNEKFKSKIQLFLDSIQLL
jgi:hypothetical protein